MTSGATRACGHDVCLVPQHYVGLTIASTGHKHLLASRKGALVARFYPKDLTAPGATPLSRTVGFWG